MSARKWGEERLPYRSTGKFSEGTRRENHVGNDFSFASMNRQSQEEARRGMQMLAGVVIAAVVTLFALVGVVLLKGY